MTSLQQVSESTPPSACLAVRSRRGGPACRWMRAWLPLCWGGVVPLQQPACCGRLAGWAPRGSGRPWRARLGWLVRSVEQAVGRVGRVISVLCSWARPLAGCRHAGERGLPDSCWLSASEKKYSWLAGSTPHWCALFQSPHLFKF